MTLTIAVTYEHDADGWYGYSPDLPGCQTQGGTREEVERNLREAVEGYLETLTAAELGALQARRVETALMQVTAG